MRLTGGHQRDRIVDWLLAHIPAPILLNPERVAIKFAVALSGLVSMLVVRPASLNALLPHWIVLIWGATWLLGGMFGLVGYWRSHRPLEMAGHRLIILGVIVYGTSVAEVAGSRAVTTVILISVIAACSATRLLIASGSRLSRRRHR